MNNYTNNGIANLASYGRGNDTELVHMTPGEVKGLQALAMAHGGSLTINPDTGLVEAGFLEQILPIVAAAGLTYLTAGAAAPAVAGALGSAGMGAAAAGTAGGILAGAGSGALISGGMAAIQGKDVGNAALMGGLGGAIAGGMGAYGDAGTFAADATQKAAIDSGTQAVTAVPAGSAPAIPTNAMSYTPSGEMVSSAYDPAITGAASPTTGFVPSSPTGIGANAPPVPSDSYYSGLKPDQYIQKAGIQALPAAGLLEDKQSVPGSPEEDEYTRRLKKYKLSPDYQPYTAPRPNPYYKATYAAEGGVMESFDDENGSDTVGMARGGMFRDDDPDTKYQDALTAAMTRLNKAGKTAGIKASALPKTSINDIKDIRGAYPKYAAGGGIMSNLGGYSDGGRMLKGPGDGMSDSIPGVIGGKQPARLADGEFVVPADVVSHLGNGSTDAGAKKLYGMMDNIRKARTGKKKQAPQVNVDKYLPGKKKAAGGIAGYAEGGITGYADGGEVAALYDSVLGRAPDAAGLAFWTNSGLSTAEIAKALAASPEAIVNQVYQEQVGRRPDEGGAAYYQSQINSGKTAADIAAEINRSLEGTNFDTQTIESAYNRNLRRTAEQEGFQFWLSAAQANPMTQKQLMDAITEAAEGREKIDRGIQGKTFTDLEVSDFVADPLGGRRATTSIYDVPKNEADRINISYINGIPVQFISPVTEKALISKYGEGAFKASMGEETYSPDRVAETADRAFRAGSMTKTEYDKVMTGLTGINQDIQAGKLDAAKAGDSIRQLLNVPKGFKIIDPKYGQQIGEDNSMDIALAEAAKRQDELAKQDPGYYQANDILGQAYLNAGLDFPFMSSDYKANTMMTQADKLTPQNVKSKLDTTFGLLGRTGPYQTQYDPINRGTSAEQTAIRDPYSDEGLKLLYGRMMDQYGAPTTGLVNPATQPYIGSTYTPPVPQRIQDENKLRADYDTRIAAERAAYEKAPLSLQNFDEKDYITRNPDAFQDAPGRPYQHYLEANRTGDVRIANKLPFTPTPFVQAPLFGPGSAGTLAPAVAPVVAAAEAAGPFVGSGDQGVKAGGLMSINRKKQAKTKLRRGLLAA
jgi:soluble cytochrome b562